MAAVAMSSGGASASLALMGSTHPAPAIVHVATCGAGSETARRSTGETEARADTHIQTDHRTRNTAQQHTPRQCPPARVALTKHGRRK